MRIRETISERVQLTEEESILVMMCEDTESRWHNDLMEWCNRRGFVPGHVEVSRGTDFSEMVHIGIRKHPFEREMTHEEKQAYLCLKKECDNCLFVSCCNNELRIKKCRELMKGKEVIE